MKKETFKKGMSALVSAFPDKSIDLELYWLFLKDLPDKEFLEAIAEIITTQKELYPGHNLIAIIRSKTKKTKTLSAPEAWGIVQKEIQRVGSWGTPKLEDPLIAKAVEIMGWKNLCLSENNIADRAHFIQIYETLQRRDEEERTKICLIKNELLKELPKTGGQNAGN